MDELQKKVNSTLTGEELTRALGEKGTVIRYSELSQYTTIEDLLPDNNDFRILLLEEERNKGHYVALMKQHNKYYYFNSYGQKYDTDLYLINRVMRRILGEDKHEIGRLLHDDSCEWNKVKYQGNSSSTCGRWCILAVTMICHMGNTMDELQKYIKKTKTRDESYDEMVVRLVPI